MSFVCLACGRQRAGAYGPVCSECLNTQMGDAAKIVAQLELSAPSDALIRDFENILDQAQNAPPLGNADGSVTERRWNRLAKLLRAARAFSEALDEAIPNEHQQDW